MSVHVIIVLKYVKLINNNVQNVYNTKESAEAEGRGHFMRHVMFTFSVSVQEKQSFRLEAEAKTPSYTYFNWMSGKK